MLDTLTAGDHHDGRWRTDSNVLKKQYSAIMSKRIMLMCVELFWENRHFKMVEN